MSWLRSAASLAAVVATLTCLTATAAARSAGYPVIHVLSVRADLVSGSQALTSIALPAHTNVAKLRISLNGRRVAHTFARRPNGLFEGLLGGLQPSANHLAVVLGDGRGAQLTIIDHPLGGPVFSGPQLAPWTCEAGATDAKCDKAPVYSYLYEKPGADTLSPYDPANPPTSVASTTTDAGVTVPFIVREEIAYEDRDQVRIETLFQPGRPWMPWAPQRQWNHKVYVMHGADCHDTRGVTNAPWGDLGGTLSGTSGVPVANSAVEDSSVEALGMGFAVMSTALDNAAADCNPALEAESVLMAKEHLTDQLGPISATIGYGCSGGSLAEQWMANAYPGLYQGLIPQCAFPDAGSAAQQIVDYEALGNYFSAATSANPLSWTPAQESEVDGTAIDNVPGVPVDATVSASAFFPFAEPTNCTDYADSHSYVPASQIYNAQTNPGGVRCGLTDWNINLLGVQPPSVWDAQEQAVGHGFANVPIDNVGVEYGLGALLKHEITPAQFVDLNTKIGGFNLDWQPVAQRPRATYAGLADAYRSGFINEANHLNQVPILDLMGPNDPGLAHDTFREFALADRLKANFGTSANLVMWQGPTPLAGDTSFPDQALKAMDGWVAAISADHSHQTLAHKVIADKPASVHDECTDGAGTVVASTLCSQAVVPVYGTPRTVAGEAQATDQNACQLAPLNRAAFSAAAITFSDAQWAALEGAFPDGVCDWSKPGIGQQPTVAWQTYQSASGKVIEGGRPMSAPPASTRCRLRARQARGRCASARR